MSFDLITVTSKRRDRRGETLVKSALFHANVGLATLVRCFSVANVFIHCFCAKNFPAHCTMSDASRDNLIWIWCLQSYTYCILSFCAWNTPRMLIVTDWKSTLALESAKKPTTGLTSLSMNTSAAGAVAVIAIHSAFLHWHALLFKCSFLSTNSHESLSCLTLKQSKLICALCGGLIEHKWK